MSKVTKANYATKLKAAILNAAITGKLTGGTNDWKTVKLGELCETCLDGDWIESKDQAPSGIRLIQTGNVGFGVYEDKGERAKYISEETFERLNCTEIFPGDILISRLPSPVGRACILPKTNSRMITAVDCSIIRPKKELLSKYLVFYASSQIYFDLINEKVTGTTRPRISRKNLESISIPLPPVDVQREIVGKVEELMGFVEVVQEGGAKIRELGAKARAKILDLAIHGKLVAQDPAEPPAAVGASVTTPPYALPPNWKWVKLGEVFDVARGGSPRPIKDYITTDRNGLNWIKIGDTIKGSKYITSVQEKIKPEGLHKTRQVYKGDLLLTNSMSFGEAYILNIDGCIHDGWLVLHPKQDVSRDFFVYLLSSPSVHRQLEALASGTGVRNLNSEKVRSVFIPLPPLGEQKRIVEKVEAMMKALEGLSASV